MIFDDQPIQKAPSQAPGNLPMSEPEDMLAGVEEEVATPSFPPPPSALGAGILKPKLPDSDISTVPPSPLPPPEEKPAYPPAGVSTSGQEQGVYMVKEPAIAKWLLALFLIAIAAAVLAGGWWLYKSLTKTAVEPAVAPPAVQTSPASQPEEKTENLGEQIVDEQILFGQPIDSDNDGLDDSREGTLGTDSKNWDTDKDSLSDGDEVLIWKTDPLNSDTDSDSYADGLEVKNGYNPVGTGKIFEPPTTL